MYFDKIMVKNLLKYNQLLYCGLRIDDCGMKIN
jgi:hypothetical protein